jgi:NIMA (never in mitosis gene a)-related kinase
MNGFELISKLGDGSYSVVYKVKRKADSKIYALKKVKLKNLSEKEKLNALNEVRILASIKSAFVISYKEAFIDETDPSLCIVMEYADKGDLHQKISYFKKMRYYFEEIDVWRIFIQMTRGLKTLHDLKILHRDLKSANIFLFSDGSAKIGDLNVSKVAKKGLGYTQTGTPYYASPEVWRDEPYDSKSDIWSLACVTYEMLTLHPPFRAESMDGLYEKVIKGKYPKINDRYSSDISDLLSSLFRVESKQRPSCSDILKNPIVVKRLEFFKSNSRNDTIDLINMDESTLLKTIRIPKNLLFLSNKLPKANYDTPTDPNISTAENTKPIQNNLTTNNNSNNTLVLPTLNKINNRYEIQNLKETKKKKLNIFIDNVSKKEALTRKNSKESLISPIKKNGVSPINKLPFSDNKLNNVINNKRHKKVIIPCLHRPKNGLSKGLSELYRLYVSNDINGKASNNRQMNKYALYLPNVYSRQKGNEKRYNSNSYIAPKVINSKKKLSPLNIKV